MQPKRTESEEREDWMRGAPAPSNPDEHLHDGDRPVGRASARGKSSGEVRQTSEAEDGDVRGAL